MSKIEFGFCFIEVYCFIWMINSYRDWEFLIFNVMSNGGGGGLRSYVTGCELGLGVRKGRGVEVCRTKRGWLVEGVLDGGGG